eukprot:1159820-Pelagomonas_calceolata.AAC.7
MRPAASFLSHRVHWPMWSHSGSRANAVGALARTGCRGTHMAVQGRVSQTRLLKRSCKLMHSSA